MRVLIAGGTGFIGRRLTTAGLERGWEVHLITRKPGQPIPQGLAALGVHLVEGDLRDAQGLQDLFSQVRPTHYFHNAGWYELGIPGSSRESMWSVNVQGLIHALDAADRSGVQKIIFTSSTTALGDTNGEVVDEHFVRQSEPRSWYEHTLYEAFQIAMNRIEAGQPIVIGSPAQVIGAGDHSAFGIMLRLFLRRLLPPTLWAPQGTFSFAHVDDVASGLIRIMEAGRIGENYFMAGGVMTNREMVEFWSETTGRMFPVVWIPRSLAMAIGHLASPLLRLAGQPAFISPEVVRSSYASFQYSDAKIRNELGVSLRTAKQGWEATIEAERG